MIKQTEFVAFGLKLESLEASSNSIVLVCVPERDSCHVDLHQVTIVSNVVLPCFEKAVKIPDPILLSSSDLIFELMEGV